MATDYSNGWIKFDEDGYSNLFEMDKMITTNVDVDKLKEFALFKPKTKLSEIDGVLRRDDARVLIPEVLNEQIQTKVQEARVGRELVQTVSLAGDSMAWLEETGFEAEQVPEGAEVPIKHATWEKFYINVVKIGVRPVITREMIEDAHWDVVRRNLDQAALAMARYEDWMIMNALNAGVPNNAAITDGVGGIGTVVGSHRINMGSGGAGDSLTWRSIAKALTVMRLENYTPDVMLIHPVQMYDLLTMEGDFIGATEKAYLTLPERVTSAMSNGTIGSIGGMRVVVSANQPAGQVLMFDSSVYGVLAERRPVSMDKYNDVVRQMEGIVLTQRLMPAAIRRDAAVMLTGGKTTIVT